MFTGQQDTFKYTVPAEFARNMLHKKGALAAARMGDDVNPNQESSPSQFYIVQGKTFTIDQLSQIEQNINHSLLRKNFVNICKQEAKNNTLTKPEIEKLAEQKAIEIQTKNPFKYTPEEVSMYGTLGGTPHLDMNYTVFGEVISGLDIIDKIASQQTNEMDRPIKDIKFSIRIAE
jgi:cyclophilin family peptidyl-prolyl cis-trans isomerase